MDPTGNADATKEGKTRNATLHIASNSRDDPGDKAIEQGARRDKTDLSSCQALFHAGIPSQKNEATDISFTKGLLRRCGKVDKVRQVATVASSFISTTRDLAAHVDVPATLAANEPMNKAAPTPLTGGPGRHNTITPV